MLGDGFGVAVVMFALQALLGLLLLFLGNALRTVTSTLQVVITDLKTLNNAVLGEYAKRDAVHNLGNQLHMVESRVAVLEVVLGDRVPRGKA